MIKIKSIIFLKLEIFTVRFTNSSEMYFLHPKNYITDSII
jgi:hypothetical protein